MNQYHISPKSQRPNICRASEGNCPLGGEHYATKEEAVRGHQEELKNADKNEHLKSLKKKPNLAKPKVVDSRSAKEKLADLSESDAALVMEMLKERRLSKGVEMAKREAFRKNVSQFSSAEDLRSTMTSLVESEHVNPGCGGCMSPHDDYCRCGEYTGKVTVNKKDLVDGVMNWERGDYEREEDPNNKERMSVRKEVEKIFRTHGAFEEQNYTAVGVSDYYGENLDRVETEFDHNEIFNDFQKLFSELK